MAYTDFSMSRQDLTPETLAALYRDHSLTQIADLCHIDRHDISELMDQYGLVKRTPKEWHALRFTGPLPSRKLYIERDELEELYQSHTTAEIAILLGVVDRTVLAKMKELGIARRTPKESAALRKRRGLMRRDAMVLPVSNEQIAKLYRTNAAAEIADALGVNIRTVQRRLCIMGISLRDNREAQKLAVAKDHKHGIGKRGANNPCWKGGRHKDGSGYILVYRPDDPDANASGYILEHRLVWREHNGAIPVGGVIHHKNGSKGDNRIENLMMLSHAQHRQIIPDLTKRIAELESLVSEVGCPLHVTRGLLGC
jgi:DNA-binding CsgD family transcriptional regulator